MTTTDTFDRIEQGRMAAHPPQTIYRMSNAIRDELKRQGIADAWDPKLATLVLKPGVAVDILELARVALATAAKP